MGKRVLDKINWKNSWKTIHAGLIDNWDLNIIYQLIHQVLQCEKIYTTGGSCPRPNVLNVRTWTRSCMPFSIARKTFFFIKHVEPIFKKRFGDNFQLNVYLIVFGPTQKIGNTASKLGIFLLSKVIKTIWIYRKLLEESKPCNEREFFFNLIKQRIEMEHFIASENEGKRERFLSYWCYESILAICTDAFDLNICI